MLARLIVSLLCWASLFLVVINSGWSRLLAKGLDSIQPTKPALESSTTDAKADGSAYKKAEITPGPSISETPPSTPDTTPSLPTPLPLQGVEKPPALEAPSIIAVPVPTETDQQKEASPAEIKPSPAPEKTAPMAEPPSRSALSQALDNRLELTLQLGLISTYKIPKGVAHSRGFGDIGIYGLFYQANEAEGLWFFLKYRSVQQIIELDRQSKDFVMNHYKVGTKYANASWIGGKTLVIGEVALGWAHPSPAFPKNETLTLELVMGTDTQILDKVFIGPRLSWGFIGVGNLSLGLQIGSRF